MEGVAWRGGRQPTEVCHLGCGGRHPAESVAQGAGGVQRWSALTPQQQAQLALQAAEGALGREAEAEALARVNVSDPPKPRGKGRRLQQRLLLLPARMVRVDADESSLARVELHVPAATATAGGPNGKATAPVTAVLQADAPVVLGTGFDPFGGSLLAGSDDGKKVLVGTRPQVLLEAADTDGNGQASSLLSTTNPLQPRARVRSYDKHATRIYNGHARNEHARTRRKLFSNPN